MDPNLLQKPFIAQVMSFRTKIAVAKMFKRIDNEWPAAYRVDKWKNITQMLEEEGRLLTGEDKDKLEKVARNDSPKLAEAPEAPQGTKSNSKSRTVFGNAELCISRGTGSLLHTWRKLATFWALFTTVSHLPTSSSQKGLGRPC